MNIKEIAKLANVSVATVSRVINNDSKVKDATKEKVKLVMKQFNYTPNSFAVRLSKGICDQVIGLIVPDIGNIFFAEMVEAISNRAAKENITILLCNTNEEYQKEKKFIELLINYGVKGIIYTPGKSSSNNDYSYIEELEKQEIPVIFLDRELENYKFDGVFLDNYKTSYIITQELLKNRYKKIYFISGSLDTDSGMNRYLGFKKAIEDSDQTTENYEIKYGDFKFSSGYELGDEILSNHNDEELVVYVANNSMALGFLKILKKYSSKFKRVVIAIFEISEVLDMLLNEENYISCKIPNKDMAEKSLEILLEKMRNRSQKNVAKNRILFNPIVINRLNYKSV